MRMNVFRNLAWSLFFLVLIVHASELRAQTEPDKKNRDISNRNEKRLERFEKQMNDLRALLKIPGLSAVILKDQKVLWAKGFGFADFENRVPATPDTVYHVASLTKLFAATLIMQMVEQGKLDLDEPASRYSSDFKDDSVKIKHLLTHTSKGTPGEKYQYSGNQFDYLTAVIEKKAGRSFREELVKTFLDPLAMSSSVPGHDVVDEAEKWSALLGKENLNRYKNSLSRFSQPYTLYGGGEIVHVPYPQKGISAAAGLLSTVLDMAKFDAAIDRHQFVKKETQEKAWTNFISNSGKPLPHGLGWFVENFHGVKLIWHYGHWGTGFSATYLKIPEKNLSLIILSNSEALSDHLFQVPGEHIVNNVFVCNFLRAFVFEDKQADDCERDSKMAVTKWLAERKANARAIVSVDPKILDAYVGQYKYDKTETEPERIWTVTREANKLFIDIPRNHKTEIFAESETKFFLKIWPIQMTSIQMTFVKKEGQVTQIDFVNYGEKYSGKRIK
jgi:CubicO group peptidase (beta-lactamase class C family)